MPDKLDQITQTIMQQGGGQLPAFLGGPVVNPPDTFNDRFGPNTEALGPYNIYNPKEFTPLDQAAIDQEAGRTSTGPVLNPTMTGGTSTAQIEPDIPFDVRFKDTIDPGAPPVVTQQPPGTTQQPPGTTQQPPPLPPVQPPSLIDTFNPFTNTSAAQGVNASYSGGLGNSFTASSGGAGNFVPGFGSNVSGSNARADSDYYSAAVRKYAQEHGISLAQANYELYGS